MEVEAVTPAFEGRRNIFRPWRDEWSKLKGLLLFTNTVACAIGKTDMSLGGFNMQLWRWNIAYKQSRKSSNTSKFRDELQERPIAMVPHDPTHSHWIKVVICTLPTTHWELKQKWQVTQEWLDKLTTWLTVRTIIAMTKDRLKCI